MKGSTSKDEDVKTVSAAGEGGGKDYIKIKNGKNFIRFMSDDFVSEYVHGLRGNKFYKEIVCLGGIKGGGYAPDACPICAEAKKHWDNKKKIKENPKFDKSKALQGEAELENKKGNMLRAGLSTKMAAVYGEVIREKSKGEITLIPEFEKEAKILNISTAQWKQLVKHKKYILTKNFLFVKENPDGETIQTTPVKIKVSKETSKAPKIDNELPDLDSAFHYGDDKEAKKILKDYLNNTGDDSEDEDDEDVDMEEEDDDDIDDEDADDEDADDKDDDDDKKKKTKKDEEDDEDEDDDDIEDEEDDEDEDEDEDDDDDEEEDEDDDKKKKGKKVKEEKKGKKTKKSKDDEDDDDL